MTPAKFQAFAKELYTSLKSIMEVSQLSTMVKLRENMWMQYASRANTLPLLWRHFLMSINCEAHCSEPLLVELVNEGILDSLIKATFPEFNMLTRATPMIDITKDEENILRYICGFIGMKLRQKFLKIESEKAAQFVECLNRMQNDGPTTSFCRRPTEVDYLISDEAYRLFISLEQASRSKLPDHLIETATSTLSNSSEEKAGAGYQLW